jgi:hypothetical protein
MEWRFRGARLRAPATVRDDAICFAAGTAGGSRRSGR